MSKRGVERGIEDLEEDVLSQLSPEERLRLFLEAGAARNQEQVKKLRETAPIYNYRATDLEYGELVQWASYFMHRAVYDLHTTSLQLALADQLEFSQWLLDARHDGELSESDLDDAVDWAMTIRTLFVELFMDYQAYRRFANEILEVAPETWLAQHPEGSLVLERVERELEDVDVKDFAAETVRDGDEENSDDVDATLDAMAEARFEQLVSEWDKVISGGEMGL